jgi:glutathione synthase/RimK-type ligase-like ATP-grasp enzyme
MIAIHNSQSGFHPRWVDYCQTHNIPHKVVDGLANDIIDQLRGCDAFMWHYSHEVASDLRIAPVVLHAAEQMGLITFPDYPTRVTFNDKVAQKYLLEAMNLPLIQSWVFNDQTSAMEWIETATFPKVFKLAGGAGSENVRLVRSASEARKLCRKMFSSGITTRPTSVANIARDLRKARNTSKLMTKLGRAHKTLLRIWRAKRSLPRHINYVYFQEFIPNADHDTRIVVLGSDRAIGLQRFPVEGDFRCSGSGTIGYDIDKIDPECVRMAFDIQRALKTQAVALDFVRTPEGKQVVVETSYGFSTGPYDFCQGYWDKDIVHHSQRDWHPEQAILDVVCETIRNR